MKTLVTTVLFACATLPALAAPVSDVPAGHWAAAAVQRMVGKKIMRPAPNGKFDGSKPVTRYELAVTLDRFVRYFEASQKPLTPPKRSSAALPANAPAPVRQALQHLTTGGYLPANSTLLTRPGGQPASAKEIADALSQVTIRLSDRSLPPQKD